MATTTTPHNFYNTNQPLTLMPTVSKEMNQPNDRITSKDIAATASKTFSEVSVSINEEVIGWESYIGLLDATIDNDDSTVDEELSNNAKRELTIAPGAAVYAAMVTDVQNSASSSNTRSAPLKRKETPESNKKMLSDSSLPPVYDFDQATQQNTTISSNKDRKCPAGQGKEPGSPTAESNTMDRNNSIAIAAQSSSKKARTRNDRTTSSSSSILSHLSSMSSSSIYSDRNVCRQDSANPQGTDLMNRVFLELQVIGHECFGKVFEESDLSDLSKEGEDIMEGWDVNMVEEEQL